ncbi:hypothetical protein B7494_g1850 [Chlorociboria aeruginascens]|nr:hypothetical protein B7494_g1850 [Chlorociboria aeruginascens]
MQFFTKIALAFSLLLALAGANTVQFVNQDSTQRTVYFTAQAGLPAIPPLTLAGHSSAIQAIPISWIGNFYSVSQGAPNVPGMLGELRFQGAFGATYFDVSAIVNPQDTHGVQLIYPVGEDPNRSGATTSGCAVVQGCKNMYIASDDVQTKSTPSTDLVCTLGTPASAPKKRSAKFSRDYVTGAI